MTNLLQVKTSATVLVETLLKLGVDSIFGYPGAAVLSIYNELRETKEIKHYLVRHEQAAVHAAEGYARTSGKTGVVLVTSGPGFTNTITGIANAYADSTPLVVLAGAVSNSNNKGKIFQHVDIEVLTKSCCKKTFTLTEKDDIACVLKKAFDIAESGVKGPVVISLPRNILEKEYNKFENHEILIQENDHIDFSYEINELSMLIKASKNPLILVGGGCINAFDIVKKFVSKTQIPVVSTLMGIGNYPSNDSMYIGMIGLNGVERANNALSSCDLLIALGCAFSDRSTCKNTNFGSNCKIVSINLETSCHDFELQIKSDISEFLSQFNNLQNFNNNSFNYLSLPNTINHSEDNSQTGLHSSYVLETLSEYTKYQEPIVVTDVGQHQMLTAQFFNFNKPRKFITSGGLGTMGFGLPAAIGAHIANPDNLVLNITGDGSFQMNLQELATCREHQIPVKVIIMNNSSLGMVRELQEKIYNNCYQVEMTNPDFTKIAEAYDLFAIRVREKEELIPALQKAIQHQGTAIVDIIIDSFENI